MSRFQRAKREQLKLRMAIDGPSGSGKTFTAILFALSLGQKVAVIDSEHGSAKKYQGEKADGLEFDFFHANLTNFSPTEYTAAIKDAGREGFDVVVVDSLSHAWSGEGGVLELKDAKGGNSFTAWRDITPMHTRMVEAILKSPCHVIVTMRSKTEYIMEPDDRGRMVPRKVGMAPVQRPGMEYEFDVYASMDWTHTLKVTKSRCSAVDSAMAVKPGANFMVPIIEWLNSGVRPELTGKEATADPEPIKVDTFRTLKDCHVELTKAGLADSWHRMWAPFGVSSAKDLSEAQAQELLGKCLDVLETSIKDANGTPHKAVFPEPASAPVPMISAEQVTVIDGLFGDLGYDEAHSLNGLKKIYGLDGNELVKVIYKLTAAQADDLIKRLTSKRDAQRQSA